MLGALEAFSVLSRVLPRWTTPPDWAVGARFSAKAGLPITATTLAANWSAVSDTE